MTATDRDGSGRLRQLDPELVARVAAGERVEDVATDRGISRSAAYRALEREEVRQEIRAIRTAMVEAAADRLASEMTGAADALAAIAVDEDAPASARVSAAKAVIELGTRLRQELDVERRLEQLERALSPVTVNGKG